MAGAIGLTQAGQAIDAILTKENPDYKSHLTRFITKLTLKCKKIHSSISNFSDKQFLLELVKVHYYSRLDKKFKDVISPTLYTNTQSYINALTRINFIPNTKTQKSLQRKALIDAYNAIQTVITPQ